MFECIDVVLSLPARIVYFEGRADLVIKNIDELLYKLPCNVTKVQKKKLFVRCDQFKVLIISNNFIKA